MAFNECVLDHCIHIRELTTVSTVQYRHVCRLARPPMLNLITTTTIIVVEEIIIIPNSRYMF